MKGYYGAYEGFEKILFNYKRPPCTLGLYGDIDSNKIEKIREIATEKSLL